MELADIHTVAVIGAGNMGHGIAEVAALSGYKVNLRDINEELVEEGYEQVEWSVNKMVSEGRLTDKKGRSALNRIETFVGMKDALSDVEFVIEAVPEQMDIKRKVYADIEFHAPEDAVLASNTSTFPITELAVSTDRPNQFCGMHFFNPPVQMPLVEVIAGERTNEETISLAEDLASAFGKTSVRIRKDVPGFAVNRVLVPMLNEAAWLVETGEATVTEIDSTAKYSLDLPMGCFELIDQIGVDVVMHVLEYMHKSLGDAYRPCPLLVKQEASGDYGKKTGQGFYNYEADGPQVPTNQQRSDIEERLVGIGTNEAAKLVADNVVDSYAIDEAVRLGAGFPKGPIEMGSELDYNRLDKVLSFLAANSGEERYQPSYQLRKWAKHGTLGESPDQINDY